MVQLGPLARKYGEMRHKLANRFHRRLHTGETVAHLGYCSLVFLEWHGALSLVALSMGIFGLAALLLGDPDGMA